MELQISVNTVAQRGQQSTHQISVALHLNHCISIIRWTNNKCNHDIIAITGLMGKGNINYKHESHWTNNYNLQQETGYVTDNGVDSM